MPSEVDINRKLRAKERKVYTDDIDDDEIEGVCKRTFSVEEKLKSDAFDSNDSLVQEMEGDEVTLKFFQKNGLTTPILVKDKTGLNMRIPGENFTVSDVRQCVGSRRMVDVMDVNTQKGMEMTMKEWVNYYENPDKDNLLNCISLEFSHTRLENYVEQPEVVRQLDWVDTAWPSFLKESQMETTNILENMKYPKVQKYCLMSVGGCYTDFHIDMGGTSVWYHILHGSKVFWLISPTEENLNTYEKWTSSGRQGDQFFGDKVKECVRVKLVKGTTFFIPTGWIHAVYTPENSLVFGGNFLHSLGVEMQLRIWEIESRTHVPSKFRYPFFTELNWYVLDRYLNCVQGKSYRIKSKEEIKEEAEDNKDGLEFELSSPKNTKACLSEDHGSQSNMKQNKARDKKQDRLDCLKYDKQDLVRPVSVKLENCMLMDKKMLIANSTVPNKKSWVNLNKFELRGLSILVEWLKMLPPTKKLVPKDIHDPNGLLADVRKMLEEHGADNEGDACNGLSIIKWPTKKKAKQKVHGFNSIARTKKPKAQRVKVNCDFRRRRVRCRKCEPCTRTDCRLCNFCKDMKKYDGPGRMKQSCISRQCIGPKLPANANCMVCSMGSPDGFGIPTTDEPVDTTIYECGICWEILHPPCHKKKHPDVTSEGTVNEDLSNSWECPKCVQEGKQGQIQPRTWPTCPKVEQKSETSSTVTSSPTPSLQDSDVENQKVSPITAQSPVNPPKLSKIMDDSSSEASTDKQNGIKTEASSRPGRRRSRSIDTSVTSPPKKILRVEITPLRDSPETHHIVSRPSSNGIKPAIMYQQQTRSSPSVIKSPQSGKSPLPTTRITSRGREINLPTRFLR